MYFKWEHYYWIGKGSLPDLPFLFYFSLNSVCEFQCGDPFKDEDIVVLNGTKEEVQKLREKMEERRAKAKPKVNLFCRFMKIH